MNSYLHFVRPCSLVSLLTLAALSSVAQPVLVTGAGVSINSVEVTAEAQRLPPDTRNKTLSKPENVGQLASNIYVRRALAAEAERAGLNRDPVVAAALKLAQERALSDALLAQLDTKNTPSDAALNQFALSRYRANIKQYETPPQISARHILIRMATPGARQKAEKLLVDLKAGADFDTLARTHSEDTGSAEKGGDLGFFPRGRMVAPFDAAAWAITQPGDLSDIVESEFGFHIIRLDARKEITTRPFEEVRDQLRKDTLATLLSDGRGRESQRLLNAATFDATAIEAYAAEPR